MNWFKKKANKKPKTEAETRNAITKTIIGLRDHKTLIAKKVLHLQKQIETKNLEARQCMKVKNKKGALTKIRLRKQLEKRVDTLENQSMNLELQILTLEETSFNRTMMTAMKNTNEAMKLAMNGMDLETVDNIQEDIAEAMELNQEFNELMATPLRASEFDDDELLAELDDILEEENENIVMYDSYHSNLNRNNNNAIQRPNIILSQTKIIEVEAIDEENNNAMMTNNTANNNRSNNDNSNVRMHYEAEEEEEDDEELRKLELDLNMAVMASNDFKITEIVVC